MSRILLQTTITEHPDDWDIRRFSLLADELRASGHDVVARDRANLGDDGILGHLDELDFDQLWLMAVDVGDGLTAAEARAIQRFRENGGGVLTAHPHEGSVSANGPDATAIARGRSTATGRQFNLAVVLDGKAHPTRLDIFEDHVRNIATWLHPAAALAKAV